MVSLNDQAASDASGVYFVGLTVENACGFGPAQTLDLSHGHGRPARWTVLLGDNGLGKTTLLRSLAAMVPVPGPGAGVRAAPATALGAAVPRLCVDEAMQRRWDSRRLDRDAPLRLSAVFARGAAPGDAAVSSREVALGLSTDARVGDKQPPAKLAAHRKRGALVVVARPAHRALVAGPQTAGHRHRDQTEQCRTPKCGKSHRIYLKYLCVLMIAHAANRTRTQLHPCGAALEMAHPPSFWIRPVARSRLGSA